MTTRMLGSVKRTDSLLLPPVTGAELGLTTDEVPEGVVNLYYTDARVGAYLDARPGTNDTTTFLRGDLTWATPPGSALPGGGTTATFLRGDSAWSNSLTGDFRVDGKVGLGGAPASHIGLKLAGAVAALAGAGGYGADVGGTLTAAANGDNLIGLNSGPTFAAGGFSGLTATGLRFSVTAGAAFSTAYGIYGTAIGAAVNWAGYFDGALRATGTATVDGGLNLGSAAGAAPGELLASAAVHATDIYAFLGAGVSAFSDTTARLYNQAGFGPTIQGNGFRVRRGTADLLEVNSGGVVVYGGLNLGSALGAPPGEIRSGQIQPAADNAISCGAATARWNIVYSVGGFSASERALKRDIQPLAPDRALALALATPISTYRYRGDYAEADTWRHAGFMADDADPLLSPDGRHVNPYTVGALALASVQALHARIVELERRLAGHG